MALFRKFFNQTRKPEGFLGKLMLSGMNSGHAKLADWGLAHLPELSVLAAVDLGCGGGRNAWELPGGASDRRRLLRALCGKGKGIQPGHDRGEALHRAAGERCGSRSSRGEL